MFMFMLSRQVVLELLECSEYDLAREMLRTSAPLQLLRTQDSDRFILLDGLCGRKAFDITAAYGVEVYIYYMYGFNLYNNLLFLYMSHWPWLLLKGSQGQGEASVSFGWSDLSTYQCCASKSPLKPRRTSTQISTTQWFIAENRTVWPFQWLTTTTPDGDSRHRREASKEARRTGIATSPKSQYMSPILTLSARVCVCLDSVW